MKDKIFGLSIILNVIFIIIFTIFVLKRGGFTYLEQKLSPETSAAVNKLHTKFKSPDHFYDERISLFNLLPRSTNDIVFIGNSRTSGCDWAEMFHNLNIKDRDITGDNTQGILNRIDSIAAYRPRKIFLMTGINDLGSGLGIDSILKDYARILDRIKILSPGTEVYVQSVLPVNTKRGLFRKSENKEIVQFNLRLKDLAAKNKYTYVDIYSNVVDSAGELDSSYTDDGLHLMGNGYFIWKKAIQSYVTSKPNRNKHL